jgi:hypothetical protein
VIAPEGEFDIAHMADFRAALFDAADGDALRLVVDLSNVSFIDSSGLGALVETQTRLRRDKRRLTEVAGCGRELAADVSRCSDGGPGGGLDVSVKLRRRGALEHPLGEHDHDQLARRIYQPRCSKAAVPAVRAGVIHSLAEAP